MDQQTQLALLRHVGAYVRKRVARQLRSRDAAIEELTERMSRCDSDMAERDERIAALERRGNRLAKQLQTLRAKIEETST